MKLTGAPVVVVGVANSVPIPTDSRTLGVSGVGVQVVTTGASTTFQVQISLDDPYQAGGIVNWFTPAAGQFTGTLSGAAVAAGVTVGSITTFCTAIRLSVSVGTSTSITAWQSDNTLGA
jgi:hypothetical protein